MICDSCIWIHKAIGGEIVPLAACPHMDPDHPAGACPVWVTACPDWLQLDPDYLIWEAKVLWQIKRLRDKVDVLIRLYK